MSAAAAFRRRDVNASDAIAEVLHPNMGYREKLQRRGIEPKDFERANRLQLKKQQAEQRRRKQAEAAARREAFKLSKFKSVQPRVFQEKTRVDEEEPPKHHDFLRRGTSASALLKKKAPDAVSTGRPGTGIESARGTAGDSEPKPWAERQKKRPQVKPPLPSRQELDALSEQLAKLHHKDKPDFVTTNAWEVIKATPSRPQEDDGGSRIKHGSFGRIPEYLMQRKEEWAREEEERRRNLPDPDCPPGMVRLNEDERVHTLDVLKKSLEEAQHQISRLPLRTETLRQIRRKDELLARVQEIEDAIQVFSKVKVYVARQENVESPSKETERHPATAYRRFRRPSQSNASAA